MAPVKIRNIWSLDIRNAPMRAGGSGRDVFRRAPAERGPPSYHCTWKLNAPAYCLNDAPVASRRPLGRYLLNSAEPLAKVGLRPQFSPPNPCLFFAFRKVGGSAGAFAAHIGEILGRAENDVPAEIRAFLEYRFGAREMKGSSFAHDGMKLSRGSDYPGKLTQDEFTKNMKPPPTSAELSAARQQVLSPEEIKLR